MPLMPSFLNLAKYVIEQLKPSSDSPVREAFAPWIDPDQKIPHAARISLDQVFNLLQLEYGRDKVNRHVSERLSLSGTDREKGEQHEIISRISANEEGNPQIVTTNFDLLFEYSSSDPRIDKYTPPAFPDLKHGMTLTGITYLHGRLSPPDGETHDYILSSSDFGRAYLAQGWATAFIRQLLERYTVVLVGYQAEDPPVKYLLQGLNSSPDHAKDRLYAFGEGRPEDVEANWRDRGVTPIPYPKSEGHAALWDSLRAWANRASNPRDWRNSVIELARKGPENCESHERGMVAHLIRTTVGAKEFADADPSPPIEWLCVFDQFLRFSKPYEGIREEENGFDPLEVYGLDDDPPRPEKEGWGQTTDRDDLIRWRRGDDSLDYTQRLAGGHRFGFELLPARLNHLARWISAQIEKPAVAWWVARQHRLHPWLIEIFERRIDRSKDLDQKAKLLWNILLDVHHKPVVDSHNSNWFRLQEIVKKEGWNNRTVRLFEAAMEPTFKIDPPFGLESVRPPVGDWPSLSWGSVARVDVHFPSTHGERLDIPEHILPSVYWAYQKNLILASEKLAEAGVHWLPLKTLYPEDTDDRETYISEEEAYLRWFVKLLEQMANLKPDLLLAHIAVWPSPEPYFFNKIRLYAWNQKHLFSGREVCNHFLDLSGDQLWQSDSRREMLILLRDRWVEFSEPEKTKLCKKLLDDKEQNLSEETEEYEAYQRRRAVISIAWLMQEGCQIPDESEKEWHERKDRVEDWSDSWVRSAASSNEMKSGWVRTNTDTSVFSGVPIAQIVDVALGQRKTRNFGEFVEHKPFIGLIKSHPARALAALANKAKKDEYPTELWDQLISNWPTETPASTTRLLLEWMRRLPVEILTGMKWRVSDWFKNDFPDLARNDERYAFVIFDDFLGKIRENGAESTKSSIAERRIGGQKIERSRRTIYYAANGIIGRAMDGLLNVLDSKNLAAEEGIPAEISNRIKLLLEVPGEGADHAICILTQQLPWLSSIDPEWVKDNLIPLFIAEHKSSEPAWSGLLMNSWVNVRKCFPNVKDDFLNLPSYMECWGWDESERESYYSWVVLAAMDPFANDILTFDEARDLLRRVGQTGRERAIQVLTRLGAGNDDGWNKYVIPFIESAWPQELNYQNQGTSKAWVSMLDDTDDAFPLVFGAVKEYIRPIRSFNLSLFRFHRISGEREPLTVKFPETVLDMVDLLVPDEAKNIPYNLSQILSLLEEVKPSISADKRFYRLRELEEGV